MTWTKKETDDLVNLRDNNGKTPKPWTKIAEVLNDKYNTNRSDDSCRNRYNRVSS